jgi:penicillin-binding protein 1A
MSLRRGGLSLGFEKPFKHCGLSSHDRNFRSNPALQTGSEGKPHLRSSLSGMNLLLLKIFATALAIGQSTTRPHAVRIEFDAVADRQEVVQILRNGCAHMRKAFDIEAIDIDDLLDTAMADPKAVGEARSFRGIDLNDVQRAYKEFCKGDTSQPSVVDVGELITFYNRAAQDLPEVGMLKGLKLPTMSEVLDGKGERFAELYQPENRRLWVSLSDIPEAVQRAFVAAEDKRFYEHKGIDERGVIRAFIGNMASPDRSQGGSTITQQVVKNLLVGNEVTYERKIREVIAATKVEMLLSKDEILELYLNSIFFGRSSWGIEMAARSYFGKSAKELTVTEGAMLAGLVKGPNYYSPDRSPGRAQERLAYVLSRMQAEGIVKDNDVVQVAQLPKMVPFDPVRRDSGFYFVDHLNREAKVVANIGSLISSSYTVRSTIRADIQRAAENSLQEGLARYELNTGRINWQGPEGNLADSVRRIEASGHVSSTTPAWQTALKKARLPLYDVHWPTAVVMEKKPSKNGEEIRVGLRDGRTLALSVSRPAIKRSLKLYDVVFVVVSESKKEARAELRVRPKVQGSAVVLDNKTGKVLAMVGGFSYPLSQLNRATQSSRQPGSALKPLTYLAALNAGLQPNTPIPDSPITLPPPGGANRHTQAKDYWTPKNYDGGSSGTITLRRALENSKNLVTARLLDGGIAARPAESLDKVCALAKEAKIYTECMRYYPFVLGAQPVRPIDLAGFYAAVANEGGRPTPYTIESIEQNGQTIYQHEATPPATLRSADRIAFYQLKTMLQGVLSRGTARRIGHLAPYVGGKTGTSDEENDAWFVGFSNDVTVAIWAGYDNADGKRRTLGGGSTGGSVAVPIFAPIMQATWASYAPRTALAPASKEAMKNMVAKRGGDVDPNSRRDFIEYFRTDKSGRIAVVKTRLANGTDVDQLETNLVKKRRPTPATLARPHDPWNQGPSAPWTSAWGQGQWNGASHEQSRPLENTRSGYFGSNRQRF